MRRYRFTYFLGQSFKGLWRNGLMTVASITVLIACLIVMGSFSLLITNINTNLDQLGLLNEIVVFVDFDGENDAEAVEGENAETQASEDEIPEEELTEEAETAAEGGEAATEEPEALEVPLTREEEEQVLAELKGRIESLKGVVGEVKLIKKEQALEEEKEKYKEYADLYDIAAEDNPLNDSFVVKYGEDADVRALCENIDNLDKRITKVNSNQELAKSIEDGKSVISFVLIWFMAILFVVSIFVIINTIKLALHSRRSEISIMRYIGATEWFIIFPFLVEGMIIGIISGVLAFFIEWYIYGYVISAVNESGIFIKIMAFNEVWGMLAVAFCGIGIVTGIIGSYISTRKYLKA